MDLQEHPDPQIRWLHRRRMAYASILAGLAFPLMLMVTTDPVLAQIAWPFYAFVGSVVAVYTGSSAWESININRSGS